MSFSKLILYGAEAVRSAPDPVARRLRGQVRRQFHALVDVARSRRGDLGRIDYRNYEGRHAINLGDVALFRASCAMVRQAVPDAELLPMNWGDLGRYVATNGERTGLVVCGSGYFAIGSDGRLSSRVKDDFDAMQRLGIPPIFLGVGLNRPGKAGSSASSAIHDEDAELVSRMLADAVAISVRDVATQDALSRLTSKPVHLTGDPALHFAHVAGARARDASFVGDRAQSGGRPRVGVNFSFHGKTSNALLLQNFDHYCSALGQIGAEFNAELLYFPHYATELIIPRMLAARGIAIDVVGGKRGTDDPSELLAAYRTLDLHVGGMLHSCILAASTDTPCIALAYDIKHRGFMELLDLGEYCLSAPEFRAGELVARVRSMLADATAIRAALAQRRGRLQALTEGFVRESLS